MIIVLIDKCITTAQKGPVLYSLDKIITSMIDRNSQAPKNAKKDDQQCEQLNMNSRKFGASSRLDKNVDAVAITSS